MAPPGVGVADLGLIALYVVVLALPGSVVAAAGGLRGWQLAMSAPLLSYGVAGLCGPWATALGIRWSLGVLLAGTVVLAGATALLRAAPRADWPRSRRRRPVAWSRGANCTLAAVVTLAAGVGAAVILGGLRRLDAVPQDWDAVFHANGIRWIADTGDAGLFGMGRVNWYEPGTAVFYPNAYHLLAAVVRQLTGRDLPSVLNAHTVLIPGMAALVLAGLVRRFGGSVVAASGTAAATVAVGALYDMLWRGPLLPYATAVALTPVFVVVLAEFLDARRARDRVGSGAILALSTAGLMCLHPATLFGAAVLGSGYLLGRWVSRPAAVVREVFLLAAAGAAGLALSFLQIAGALHSAASFPPVDWPADLSARTALVELLTFGHAAPTVQVWLTVFAAVGLVFYGRLGELRWVGGPLLVFGVLFVLCASSDAPWVNAVTRPWWNDRFRLVGAFSLLACVLVGHGLAQASRGVVRLLTMATSRGRIGGVLPAHVRPAVAAAGVLVAFVVLSNGLYFSRNATRMGYNVGEGPAVSSGEITAMKVLGGLVPSGTRVLNDRNDGSAWMYALDGVLPVAGHYDATGLGETDVGLVETRFNQYDHDPAVRAAVARLHVEYVMVDQGFLRAGTGRAPGLTDLDGAPYLDPVFRNADATIYRIVDTAPNRP
jgi:hypothetical protein